MLPTTSKGRASSSSTSRVNSSTFPQYLRRIIKVLSSPPSRSDFLVDIYHFYSIQFSKFTFSIINCFHKLWISSVNCVISLLVIKYGCNDVCLIQESWRTRYFFLLMIFSWVPNCEFRRIHSVVFGARQCYEEICSCIIEFWCWYLLWWCLNSGFRHLQTLVFCCALQWQQMDIEYTFWQMLYLCTSPKVV